MGTIKAIELFNAAAEILQDKTFKRWTKEMLLRWLNAGQREVVIADPTANTVNAVAQLVAGTRQTLPEGGLKLIEATRNMGADKATPDRVPRLIAREEMDAQNPGWHRDRPCATVLHYVYDERDRQHYYVWPPQPATGQGSLELIHSAAPAPVANENDTIKIDDIYENALVNYLLHRAYNLDPVSIAKSGAYYQAFLLLVLGKGKMEKEIAPES